MTSDMATGFLAGAGVDPNVLRVVLMTVASSLILTMFAWLILQLNNAYKDDRLTAAEALGGGIKATVVLTVLFSFLALL